MSGKSEIRKEIEKAISTDDTDILSKIEQELDVMEVTDGLDNKNNLEQFYDLWQIHKGEEGQLNEINSWTAYAIGMTKKEPDGEFLPLRRAFARAGFPDVDTDFDDERRDEVYKYMIDKWGRENVGNIGTYIGLKMKAAIRSVIRATDAAYAFHKGPEACRTENFKLANEISDTLPTNQGNVVKARDEDGNEIVIKRAKDAYKYIPDFKAYMDKYPEIMKHVNNIEGLASNFGQHPAGVVISDIPLEFIAPLRKASRGPGFATQYTMEDLESIGLIKFDILAIAALTLIKEACSMVESNYNIDIDIENLPLDDEKTLSLYRSGNLNGVFQCESSGMQQTMKEIGVNRFDDVMAAIALYRPGPMDSIPEYVARKNGNQPVSYFHPKIEPFVKEYLEKTYSVLVYQEQLMQICNSLAGFTITDGYIMIKAIGKKKEHLMNKFESQFISGGVKNGVPEDVMKQYWEKFIKPFASYGFNVAHSCCYAYLSWQTAYLKANYPDEFTCAFLNTVTKRAKWDHVSMMESDGKRVSNIKILDRNLTDCDILYKIVRKRDKSKGIYNTEIRPGLCCKGVGWETAKEIARHQPYNSIDDVAAKTNSKAVTSEAIGSLIDAGFFKGKSGQKKKDQIIERFLKVRKGLKAASAKGIASQDLFE